MMRRLSTLAFVSLALALAGCSSDTLQGTGGPSTTDIYVATSGGVSVSLNGGSSWTTIGTLANVNSVVAVNSGTFRSLYAATDSGLYLSTDGSTWPTTLLSGQVNGVVVSGQNIYAATSSGVSVSTDSGATWNTTSIAGGALGVFATATTVYVGTASAGLWIFASSGGTGTQYTNASTLGGLPSDSVNAVFDDGTNCYAATAKGLAVSPNDFSAWTADTVASEALASDVVQGVFVSGSTIYAATSAGLSVGSGSTWTPYLTGQSVNSVFVSGASLYVATNAGVWISLDNGATWRNYTTAQGLASNTVKGITVQ